MSEGGKVGGKGKGRGRGRGAGEQQTPKSPGTGDGSPTENVEGAMAGMSLQAMPSTKSKESSPDSGTEEENFLSLIRRPGVGRKGRPIKLITNHFPMTLPKNFVVQHYDLCVFKLVTAKGSTTVEERMIEKLPKLLASSIYTKMLLENQRYFPNRHTLAFDGQKNIFSKNVLDINRTGREFKMQIRNEERNVNDEFLVRVKHVREIDVDLRKVFDRNLVERKSEATLVLDVILKQTAMFDPAGYIPIGRRVFYHPDPRDCYPLGPGLVRYPGFWQSVRPVSGWKVMINLDQANTTFVKEGPVINLVKELMNFRSDRDLQQKLDDKNFKRMANQLQKLVKGLKVNMTQRRDSRTAKCLGVTMKPASSLMFPVTLKNGQQQQISVADYFRQCFRNREFINDVRFPNLPCLWVGSPNKKNYVPIEFCSVKEGQRYPKKLDDRATSKMLGYASQGAPERQQKIQDDAEFMKFDQDPYLKGFNFTVSLKMAEVTGRVLQAPGVEYQNQKFQPKEGGWNMRDVKVLEGCTIRNFAVISTVPERNCTQQDIKGFVDGWVRCARGMGFKVLTTAYSDICFEAAADNMPDRIKEMKRRVPNLDMVFVVLPSQNTDFYAFAKCGGDVMHGVNTQCIQLKNVQQPKPAMLANLCLKINGKLGGVNSKLNNANKQEIKHFLQEPILFLGADVNHPNPGDTDMDPISCAAVVGNVDLYPSLYSARILLQHREVMKKGEAKKKPQEWVEGMKDSVKMIFEHFVERNRCMPTRIVMYRDGVGETMFLQVLTKELSAIREACKDMETRFPEYVKKSGFTKGYEPPITFIVVQKRHHTRLFCANAQDRMGRGGNVPPGTTVDTEVVHPEEFDFYLCSHLGLQGTSRPAHYHVLWDDSNFSADDLETLTYYLCHTYVRATKSVSIPPPCYYADLVAYRARKYLESRGGSSSDASSLSSESRRTGPSITDLQRFCNVDESIVKKGMFFV